MRETSPTGPDMECSSDPDLEADLHLKAWNGFQVADLKPLAELMRSKFAIDPNLRIALAGAIEGVSSHCQITARRSGRGRPSKTNAVEAAGEVWAFYVGALAFYSKDEAAIAVTMEAFGKKRTAVRSAIRSTKKRLSQLSNARQRTSLEKMFKGRVAEKLEQLR